LNLAELIAANITIKLQQLLPSRIVATLHKALIFFIEHTLKPTENEALLRCAQVGTSLKSFCKKQFWIFLKKSQKIMGLKKTSSLFKVCLYRTRPRLGGVREGMV